MDGVQMVGVLGLAVVLVLVAAVVVLRRHFDGRLRSAAPPEPGHSGGFGQNRQGKGPGGSFLGGAPSLADAGIALASDQVTVVQFSGEYCAVCPQARALVQRVLQDHPEIAHTEVDVADHLDAVRALDIRRTPTVLIVDGQGRALHRVSGMPRENELRHALADLVDHR
ncbi:MAG: TlpA family protein disulfide reductase [Geodermatophilaceae bacterium]|jgi:thiol-disulfide isomerase/thioredoxin